MTTDDAVVLGYPLRGTFRARNSPARRVPSHGTHLMGTTYAIDLIPVDPRGRSAPPSWRALVTSESPERFVGFGAPVLAPVTGRVVIAHDGEPDHAARRSQPALAAYLAGQARRLREGPAAIAGNHVVIAADEGGPFILVAHLRRGSVAVVVGERMRAGQFIGRCGNSGNSTQPHVHLQATDSTDWPTARGLPIVFDVGGRRELTAESQLVSVDEF
ncbi:M23 family metallopeptidase [Herbiconiux sp. VKM Ac-1786]|uniref:M23 family metallopeptidase n=1 Tax=Herbiconiux sp. VKM Ac-1786 TaxID=2783824 RepID=UPI00188AEA0E|nr:M23 family metallopeptidase [Herbiconiux sp. VKM Ac-1786]MBF4574298.1 M23 family metallopeptidase [Herbiconiux sp. VKM Ac-1786]